MTKRKQKQEMALAQDYCYDFLKDKIQNEINKRVGTHEIQQIDYFGMSDNESTDCSAFILFRPLMKRMDD